MHSHAQELRGIGLDNDSLSIVLACMTTREVASALRVSQRWNNVSTLKPWPRFDLNQWIRDTTKNMHVSNMRGLDLSARTHPQLHIFECAACPLPGSEVAPPPLDRDWSDSIEE